LVHIVSRMAHFNIEDTDKMFKETDLIKVKALCLFENDGYIFVFEAYDGEKKDYFYRPVGGTNEFQEYTIDTLKREINEELNT